MKEFCHDKNVFDNRCILFCKKICKIKRNKIQGSDEIQKSKAMTS